jgi:methylenetetrahydrofolate reductase (NADPH)
VTFRDALSAGEWVVTAELGPPANPDADEVRRTARALAPVVHAANITDNQAATVKVSPVAGAVWMLEEGVEPILQLTTRDRNLLALQSELLGAWALGVHSLLTLSGDPLKVGAYDGIAKPVSDIDSTGLVRLVAQMNAGRLAAGEELRMPTDFAIGSAMNPLLDSIEKIEQKIEAGVHFFQTNIVFDVDRFAEWYAAVVAAGVPARAPVLVGVTPPRSSRALHHMHDNIPGVEVDAATFAALDGLLGAEAKAAGLAVAAGVVRRLRDVSGVAGVHLMAPGWEAEAVPRLVADAGLSPGGDRAG